MWVRDRLDEGLRMWKTCHASCSSDRTAKAERPRADTGPRLQPGEDARLGVDDEAEEVPATAVPGDGQGRGRGRMPAGPLDLDISDLGHEHPAVLLETEGVGVEADRLQGVLLRLVPERPTFRPCRLPQAVEEVLVGSSEVSVAPLGDCLAHLMKSQGHMNIEHALRLLPAGSENNGDPAQPLGGGIDMDV